MTSGAGNLAAGELVARRRFLALAGGSVAGLVLLAGCGDRHPGGSPRSGRAPASTGLATTGPATTGPATTAPAVVGSRENDIVVLRTATSVELALVAAYERILASRKVKDATVNAAVTEFLRHHRQHVGAVGGATVEAGGSPYRRPNAVVISQVVNPALARATTQDDLLLLAYHLENTSAQTAVSVVGGFHDLAFNPVLGSIAGAEAAHMTVLATSLSPTGYPQTPGEAFLATGAAIRAGQGV